MATNPPTNEPPRILSSRPTSHSDSTTLWRLQYSLHLEAADTWVISGYPPAVHLGEIHHLYLAFQDFPQEIWCFSISTALSRVCMKTWDSDELMKLLILWRIGLWFSCQWLAACGFMLCISAAGTTMVAVHNGNPTTIPT